MARSTKKSRTSKRKVGSTTGTKARTRKRPRKGGYARPESIETASGPFGTPSGW